MTQQNNNQNNQQDNSNKTNQHSNNNQHGDTSNRGFASMDAEKQREIASQGGKAAHESGNAHEFGSEEAREAGRKGGQNSHKNDSNTNQSNKS